MQYIIEFNLQYLSVSIRNLFLQINVNNMDSNANELLPAYPYTWNLHPHESLEESFDISPSLSPHQEYPAQTCSLRCFSNYNSTVSDVSNLKLLGRINRPHPWYTFPVWVLRYLPFTTCSLLHSLPLLHSCGASVNLLCKKMSRFVFKWCFHFQF